MIDGWRDCEPQPHHACWILPALLALFEDVLGTAAIGCCCGAAHLAFDHLRKADDRVERRAQFVSELAERIVAVRVWYRRIAAHGGGALIRPWLLCGAAIAVEMSILLIEERYCRNAPLARGRPMARDREPRIPERRTAAVGACRVAIHAMIGLMRGNRYGFPYQRPARCALNP